MSKKRVIYLKSNIPHTTSEYYSNALNQMDIDLVEILFDPHEQQPHRDFGDGDLLLFVDCGLPVEFPGMEEFNGCKAYISIDSTHKLKTHQDYVSKYNFDRVWVAQKNVVSELGENAQWLPLAADETVHAFRPEMVKLLGFKSRFLSSDYYEVGMCGAPYKHRRNFEKIIRQEGISTNFHFRKRFGMQVTAELAKCTVGLNVAAGYTGLKGKDVNMRVFETIANGLCLCLTNFYGDMGFGELFEEGVHYEGFRTDEEALEKIKYYLSHQKDAINMAREGQRHILANHTYRHRCEVILGVL